MGTDYYYLVISANDKNFTPTKDQIMGIFQIFRKHDVVPASAESAIKDVLKDYPKTTKRYEGDTYLLDTGYPVKSGFFKAWLGKDYWRLLAALKGPSMEETEDDPAEISAGIQVNSMPFRAVTGDVEYPFRFQIMDVFLGETPIWEGDADPGDWSMNEPLEGGDDDENDAEEEGGEETSEEMEDSYEKTEKLVAKFGKMYAALLADLQEYLGCPVEAWIDEELHTLGSRRINPSQFDP